MKFWSKLRALFAKETLDAEMAEEMQAHLDAQTEANLARGLSPDEARCAARRQFGGMEQIKECARDQRGWIWLEQLGQDLRQGVRQMLRRPGFAAVVILSLAVGIGANTVVFSWLKSAIFEPLPGVTAPAVLLEPNGRHGSTSWLEYQELRGMLPSFAAIAAHRSRSFYLGDSEREPRAYGEYVSDNFFSVLGVSPQLGRFFRPEEATRPGSAPVAVIAHDFWKNYFKGAPDVVGRTLRLNQVLLTVIGVAPEGFRGGMDNLAFDFWVPATMASELHTATTELTRRYDRRYLMLALLKPGVTPGQARGELAAAAKQLIAMYPETNRRLSYELLPLWRSPRGGQTVVTSLATLQVFASLILVVVCANTATLLLARASVRQREIGVRLAIGAGPRRIVGQLLIESLCLAVLGAGVGIVFAQWGLHAIGQIPLPGNLPLKIAPSLDWWSLLFTAGLGITCGVAFGLAPALQLARGDVLQSLRGGRGVAGGRSRLRDLLVGLEVATALVVLVLAGLFLKSFRNSLIAQPGFDTGHVMLASVDLAGRGYDRRTGGALLDDLLQRLAAIPGVESTAAATYVPLDIHGANTGIISVEGKEFDPNRTILYYGVTSGYFDTMGIPFIDGTDIAPLSRYDLQSDAVINEEMARRYWPEGSAVGRRFKVGGGTYVVAGVVRNSKLEKLTESPGPAAWITMRSHFGYTPTLHLRVSRGDPRALHSAIKDVVHRFYPELAVLDPRSIAQHIENNLFLQRVPAQMLAVLGPLALVLAAMGLYAVLAYAVAQRRQEIGVRLTLGATPGSVVRLMIWQSMRVVLVSAAAGWALALVVGWSMKNSFVGVRFGDPLIYGGVPALLVGIALLACWLPAQRAAKVDPMVALRSE